LILLKFNIKIKYFRLIIKKVLFFVLFTILVIINIFFTSFGDFDEMFFSIIQVLLIYLFSSSILIKYIY
jgi:hypothetical protein